MKKLLFLLLAICGAYACTTPEEDAQIKLFWLEQIMQLMPKQAQPAPLPPQPLPVIPTEEEQPAPAEEQVAPTTEETVASAENKQPNAVPPTVKPVVARRNTQNQFMEITLEKTRVNKFKSNASLKDRQAMQRAIERVKKSNQQALEDIGAMFGGDTQAQAFAVVLQSEKILMRTANTSNTYQNYLNAQRKILQEQEAQLNQLMRQNAYKLRRVRG